MEISVDDFREEMSERLAEWESCILDFEKNPSDSVITNNLFRVVHTIKGVSGACGYFNIMNVTHGLESYLDQVRHGDRVPEKRFIDIMLRAGDLIGRMVYEPADSTSCLAEISVLKSDFELIVSVKSADCIKSVDLVEKKTEKLLPPRFLRSDTIPRLRSEVLASLTQKEEYKVDLSEVQDCDADGIHFLCSLVPVFLRSGVSLTIVGISDVIINSAFSLGIDIRNVLKRASHGKVDPTRGRVSHFTITLHPAPGMTPSGYLENELKQFQHFLHQNGNFTEQCQMVDGQKQDCTLLLSTTLSRDLLEAELGKLPQELLWTISLTPDQAQKNDALRHITQGHVIAPDVKRLVHRWGDRFDRLCELAEVSGNPELFGAVQEIREIQTRLKGQVSDIEDIPLSVFREAMKIMRGE